MTIIRKSILVDSGNWAEWCICEDAELGLRVQSLGYDTVYVKDSFGKGLTPNSFAGYKRQRFRWVYGAVQILKRHWSILSPFSRNSGLNLAQRYHFIAHRTQLFTAHHTGQPDGDTGEDLFSGVSCLFLVFSLCCFCWR